MDNKLKNLIIKSFELYDNQNHEYKYLFNSISKLSWMTQNEDDYAGYTDIPKTDLLPKIYFNDTNTGEQLAVYSYETLGIFDMKTKVWCWSWSIPLLDKIFTTYSKKLLKYALSLNISSTEESDNFFMKTQFINSRIFLKDKIQLDILIATCSYILGRDVLFIYPHVIKEEPSIIQYLLIKIE